MPVNFFAHSALLAASRWLWPLRCLVCAAAGNPASGLDLCQDCEHALPWNTHACLRCAMPLPGADGGTLCGACLARRNAPLDQVHACFRYTAPLDRLLPAFKFHQSLAAGRLITQLMAKQWQRQKIPRPDLVIPIPLHVGRLRQRGYDQALEIARPLARALALPLAQHALYRLRATHAQSELDKAARKRNLRNAFALHAKHPLPAHVALIDDVMTTGATLESAALALRRAGVRRVDAWVCARA